MKSRFYSAGILSVLIIGMAFSGANAQHQEHMPAKAVPKASPKPTPTPSQTHSGHQPAEPASPKPSPSASPKPAGTPASTHEEYRPEHQRMDTPSNLPLGKSPPSHAAITDEEAGDTRSLMTMYGDRMAVRIGNSATNVIPMGRIGSGTSWLPASTPSHMIHKQSGEWLLMFHYNATLGINAQGGLRGVTKVESANWFMPMAMRRLGNGTLELRSMFSFEPFTFPPGGSPLLFQTGETYKGQPLIDRQHPHDLFMELSASYTLALGERATWFAYFGYPGEPALGPTAFMHRASASENPSAVLSHHLQDSSHISFGVFTTGFTYRWFKLEGSVFNGQEPDEDRYDFDAHRWNSRSARLTVAPNDNWSIQVSQGFLRDPEAIDPGDVRRTTASITYNRPLKRGNWATSLIWGRNHEGHGDEIFNLNGYVAESTINFLDKNYVYTRLELADKNSILRTADRVLLGITDDHPSFRIGAYTFGGARDLWTSEKLSVALGGDATFYSKPSILNPIYGNNPTSYRVFLRFRPGRMKHATSHSGGHTVP